MGRVICIRIGSMRSERHVAASREREMLDRIEQLRPQIIELCRKYGVKRLELFGSVARGDFNGATSDVDFFYELDPACTSSVADRFFGLKDDLEALVGVKVDLVSAVDAVNPYFLQVANRHRVMLYAA